MIMLYYAADTDLMLMNAQVCIAICIKTVCLPVRKAVILTHSQSVFVAVAAAAHSMLH